MKKPSWIKKGVEVKFDCAGEAIYGAIANDSGDCYPDPTDGREEDALVGWVNRNGDEEDQWISWEDLTQVTPTKKEKKVPIPNKAKRKEIAAKVKKAYDALIKEIAAAQGVGLGVSIYIDSESDEREEVECCCVSYQPPTPPVEAYIS
jgi:hypothetical protein